MQCPECGHHHIRKNGHRRGQQNHICVNCDRPFIEHDSPRGYDAWTKRLCLRMDVNGLGFRGIKRVIGVAHTTVIDGLAQVGEHLPDAYDPEEIPPVGELDELETFVGCKRDKVWIWTVLDHFPSGILGWAVGDHSAETFRPLWPVIACWPCFFWGSDGNPVYPTFIPVGDPIVSTTDMTRVAGENTRLRHYLARLHRKTLCYSKSVDMLKHSIRLLIHYLKFGEVPIPA
jgi:insertion element IS1 protein InsB